MAKKTNKMKKINKQKYEPLIVDVSKRSDIKIEKIKQISDFELDRFRKESDEISKNIKLAYYSDNSMIENIQKRRFVDLFKKFINSLSFFGKRQITEEDLF